MDRGEVISVDGRTIAGLILKITGKPMPGLRFEVAGSRRLVLRQDHGPVLLGSVDADHYGIHLHHTGDYQAPLHALTAAQGRRMGDSREPAWLGRWAHRFSDHLAADPHGPLHDGSWTLHTVELPPYSLQDDLVRTHPDSYLDWLDGWNGVVPLQQLPDGNSARVKAYRKQARDGTLPPILLLAASALDGYLLLDGHARLVAAQSEDVQPAVLVLGRRLPQTERQALLAQATATWERAGQREPAAVGPASRSYAQACADIERSLGRTLAWPLAGGEPAWRSMTEAIAPQWLAEMVDATKEAAESSASPTGPPRARLLSSGLGPC